MATLALEQTKIPPTQLEMSAWTPRNNKKFNVKLFQERFELIKKWYAAWSENQKWQLIEHILLNQSDKDIIFLHSIINPLFPPPPPPVKIREDFTRSVPRFLSLKILSYLDPRSLCRASQVSWYWNTLCQQNILWRTKCLKYGWFLPSCSNNSLSDPNSLWKRHYISCVHSMFWKPPKPASFQSPLPSSPDEHSPTVTATTHSATTSTRDVQTNQRSATQHSSDTSKQPLWKHSSRFPNDLLKTSMLNESIKMPSTHQQQLLLSKALVKHHSTDEAQSTDRTSLIICNAETTTNDLLQTADDDDSHDDSDRHNVRIKDGSVPVNALMDPMLIEKIRLEEPSEHSVIISTINNNETGQSLAKRVECLQEEAPFPKLKPYYVETLLNRQEQATLNEEDDGEMMQTAQVIETLGCERSAQSIKKTDISSSSGVSRSDCEIDQKVKNEPSKQTIAQCKNDSSFEQAIECVREWTTDDFDDINSSSESDIF